MATLAEIRQQYPQYDDMSDEALSDALYRKFYSDMPRAEFDARVGASAESETSRALRQEFSDRTLNPGAYAPQRQSGEQTYGDAATAWLEHSIGDLPIVGPALQGASDYLGTEVYGRLSGQDPSQMREDIRARREGRTADYPMSSVSGALAGNLAAFGAAGATKAGAQALGISGARLLPRVANSALSSGTISAADRLARGGDGFDAVESGAIGAGIGGAIPVVGGLVRAGLGAVGDKVYPVLNSIRNPIGEAERRLGSAVARDAATAPASVMNAADEAAANSAGVPLLNVDRGGETTRALARSVANQSPEARSLIERAANDRFSSQASRAANVIRRVSGGSADDLAFQEATRAAARAANKPAYARAFSAPQAQSMWNEGFEQLMQAPAMQTAARQATTRGANRAAVEGFTPVRNPFRFGADGRFTLATDAAGRTVSPNLAFWDQVKRNLDGMVGKAERAGDRTLAADLTALRSHLVRMTDAAVPEYQSARQGAAAFFGAEDALDAGRKFAGAPRTIPETRRAFMQFTAPERKAFATGYASELIDRIKASRDRANVIDQVFKSEASRESMNMVFGPARAREIEAYVRVEDLADRLRGAMGNSTTARQLVELGIGAGSGFAVSGGDWKGALTGAMAAKGARYLGQRIDDRVMQQIAKMLTSNDAAAFNRVVANASLSPAYMQKLEALGRLLAAPSRAMAVGAGQ